MDVRAAAAGDNDLAALFLDLGHLFDSLQDARFRTIILMLKKCFDQFSVDCRHGISLHI